MPRNSRTAAAAAAFAISAALLPAQAQPCLPSWPDERDLTLSHAAGDLHAGDAAYALDADGDGDLDLIVRHETGGLLLVNDGGAFSVSPLPVGADERFAAGSSQPIRHFHDFDGDGDDDAIGSASPRAKIWRNTRGEGGQPLFVEETTPGIAAGYFAAVTDWNNDGLPDLIVSDVSYAGFSVCTNNPDAPGSFVEAHVFILRQWGDFDSRYFLEEAGDFDGDGLPDLLVRHTKPDQFSGRDNITWLVYRNTGTNLQTPYIITAHPAYETQQKNFLGSGELDADGRREGVWSKLLPGGDQILVERFDLATGASESAMVGSLFDGFRFTAADLNGDGLDDVLYGSGDVRINDGDPAFPTHGGRRLTTGATSIVGDLDGDTVPDLVFVTEGSTQARVALSATGDADGNGVLDFCQPDCDGDRLPDAWAVANGLVPDCDANGEPDSCDIARASAVDVVFVMDTSGSMSDEAAALCATVQDVVAELAAYGLNAAPAYYAILALPGGAFDCLDRSVADEFGYDAPGGLTLGNEEDWANAVGLVAEHYPWSAPTRIIVPISDEGPRNGDPCDASGEDGIAIDNAIAAAATAGAVVSPIGGTGSSQCVVTLGERIADATGGVFFLSTDPEADLARAIRDLVLLAAGSPDCDANGVPDACEIRDGLLPDCNANGIPDACDIAFGFETDADGDLVPDSCQACPADFDGDAQATVNDLLAFLGAFRNAAPEADVDASGDITVNDLLAYLGAFRAGC